MKHEELRRRLERVEIPDEHEARIRAWDVIRTAFADHEPGPRQHSLRPVVAIALAAAVVAATVSAPGRAVLDSVREAIGVTRVQPSQPALVALPAPGRLLVNSSQGPWIVHADGSKRLLGRYRQASWSPRGRFVVATGAGEVGSRELFALDPKGNVRWSLARRSHIREPRWAPSGYRIAYIAGASLRVVAGDGSGDTLLAPHVQPAAPPAWRPGSRHLVAYVQVRGEIVVADADTRRPLWRRRAGATVPFHLEWSRDGSRLLVVASYWLAVYDASGRRVGYRTLAARAVTAAIAPDGRRVALSQRSAGDAPATIVLVDLRRVSARPRRVFMGSGVFSDLAWSPHGTWIAAGWPTADQWLFVRTSGARKVEAVANAREQFGGGGFPQLGGWCCA